MSNAPDDQSLTDEEFDRLSVLLDAIGAPAMNIEILDGYFAALICGPSMVLPNEYIPEIWSRTSRSTAKCRPPTS